LLASLFAAAILSAFVARRIIRPIGAVQYATRRLAVGHYDERVPVPRETELAGLAADVNQLAATLEGTERRRAQLISDVAHELRTPLTNIRGYMEGIADGVFQPTDQIIVAVTDEVTRLQRLADDLSSLSKLDEGVFELHVDRVDLAQLTTRATQLLRTQFDDKGVGLDVRTPSPVYVTVDPDRVTQILRNLLGNALTYTPPGGQVVVTCGAEPDAALVAIADTGIGLEPDELEHVFERFYRAPAVERPPGGSGIGLSIARSIARAHNGDVIATSPGRQQGAAFTLRLPRSID
jgi:histidine kinase